MWQVYQENVDPIVKILHVPTVEILVKETRKNLDSLTPGNEALMFAIYFAAITSMDEEDVSSPVRWSYYSSHPLTRHRPRRILESIGRG
jgi:hypothetical protein